MVGPGLIGAWLDRRWGSSLCTPAGFLLGMALATTALVVIAQKLAPAARGKPLPLEDPDEDEDSAVADNYGSRGHGQGGGSRDDSASGGAGDAGPKL